jgi:hypothetical protein
VARERRAQGAEPRWVALVVAAYALHVKSPADAVLPTLDEDLAADQVFRDLVAEGVQRLSESGASPC